MHIRKAVFPVACFGDRFLPATKVTPKELLPIVDKPLTQYAAEEAIAGGIDTLIFVTGRNKRAIEVHFDANNELETMWRAKGKDAQADMVCNIIPEGLEFISIRQADLLGLEHVVLCAQRVVVDDPFAVLLADYFLTDYAPGVTVDLAHAFANSGKSQLLVMEVDGPDIFETLRGLSAGSGRKIQLVDAINMHAQRDSVEIVRLTGRRFDCGSVDGSKGASNHVYNKRLEV